MTEFGVVTQLGGEECFQGPATPKSQASGALASPQKMFGTPNETV